MKFFRIEFLQHRDGKPDI